MSRMAAFFAGQVDTYKFPWEAEKYRLTESTIAQALQAKCWTLGEAAFYLDGVTAHDFADTPDLRHLESIQNALTNALQLEFANDELRPRDSCEITFCRFKTRVRLSCKRIVKTKKDLSWEDDLWDAAFPVVAFYIFARTYLSWRFGQWRDVPVFFMFHDVEKEKAFENTRLPPPCSDPLFSDAEPGEGSGVKIFAPSCFEPLSPEQLALLCKSGMPIGKDFVNSSPAPESQPAEEIAPGIAIDRLRQLCSDCPALASFLRAGCIWAAIRPGDRTEEALHAGLEVKAKKDRWGTDRETQGLSLHAWPAYRRLFIDQKHRAKKGQRKSTRKKI